jgi:hypothetical protein
MASADFSLRSSGDARRPFGHKARSPQVRVVNFPAQPLDIRRHLLVVRASRTDARSPWMASPLIHRTRVPWSGCFLFVGSRFRYRFFQCRPLGRTGSPACSPCELLGVATTSFPRGLPPPIHAHAGHTSGSPAGRPAEPPRIRTCAINASGSSGVGLAMLVTYPLAQSSLEVPVRASPSSSLPVLLPTQVSFRWLVSSVSLPSFP